MHHRNTGKAAVAWAAIDLLGCLFLVMLVLANPPAKKSPPRIATDGQYAVTIEWSDGSPNDVDLYVEDPDHNIVYFGTDHIGLMNLENDDLGSSSDTQRKVKLAENHERVILRGVVTGEYIVNVHMYGRNGGPSPERVRVHLWKLRGDDTMIHEQVIDLGRTGDEQTAFRFRLDGSGRVNGYSRLSRKMVQGAVMQDLPDGHGSGSLNQPDSYNYHLGNGTTGP